MRVPSLPHRASRSFGDELASELKASHHEHEALSLVLARVEGLEPSQAQDVLRRHLTPSSTIGRIGGTCAVIVRCNQHVAFSLAERLSEAVREENGASAATPRARFGLATSPADATTAADLVDAASTALAAAEDGLGPPVTAFSRSQTSPSDIAVAEG